MSNWNSKPDVGAVRAMPATDKKAVKHDGMPGRGETVDPCWPLSVCLAEERKSKKLVVFHAE